MKKRLDTDAIASELREHSGFFRRPPGPEPAEQPARPDAGVSRHPDPQVPRPLGARVPGHPGPSVPGRHDAPAPRRPAPPAASGEGKRYDLTERAEERQTLRLTEGEFRRLGVLQGSLSEQLGVRKVDKNDIIRAALHRLYEDVDARGSDVVVRLRKKYR